MNRLKNIPIAGYHNMKFAALLCSGVFLSSCGTVDNRADHVRSTPPTVTYQYSDDQILVDAIFKAEEYCLQFNAWPSAASGDSSRDGEITFVCEQERGTVRTSETVEVLREPTIRYSYHDQAELVAATSRAQRHCARFGARARSVTLAEDEGKPIVVFECAR